MRRYIQTFLRTIILGLSVPALFTSAFISCTYGAAGASPDMPVADSGYLLGPEDVLLISVWKDEHLTREVVVRPDGIKKTNLSTSLAVLIVPQNDESLPVMFIVFGDVALSSVSFVEFAAHLLLAGECVMSSCASPRPSRPGRSSCRSTTPRRTRIR